MKYSEDAGILIQIYIKDKVIDSIIVGAKDKDNGWFFARRPNSNTIWLVGGEYDIPMDAKSWLPHPILDIPTSAIEMLGIDGVLISRQMAMEDFRDRLGLSVNVDWLLQTLSALEITDVADKEDFYTQNPDAEMVKIYDISTFYGLRFEIELYQTKQNQIWANIKISNDTIALTAVNDYIKDNNFLYQDWYFQISPLQKDFLMNYKLL